MDAMHARAPATAALVAMLAFAGCGSKQPAPFKEVKQPSSVATTAPATVGGPSEDPGSVAALAPKQRADLTPLVNAHETLIARGDAVAAAGSDADKLVGKVGAGFAPPAGPVPEVGRLADALGSFSETLGAIATQADLMARLSTELQLRYQQLLRKQPASAARVLEAKQEVDSDAGALARLSRDVDDAAAKARALQSKDTLDADALEAVITAGSASATSALNGVNHALETGIRALAAA